MGGICQDCIIKMRNLAALRFAMDGRRMQEKREAEDDRIDIERSNEDMEREMTGVLDQIFFKLNTIREQGANDPQTRMNYSTLRDSYEVARGQVFDKDFDTAGSTFQQIYADGLNREYAMALDNAGAEKTVELKIRQAEMDIESLRNGDISASTAPASQREDEAKTMQAAVDEAKKHQDAGKMEEALTELNKVSAWAPEKKEEGD
ncbi:hypothetical protein ACFLRF_05495 [Candidatus Altiarchaeota archaeon]